MANYFEEETTCFLKSYVASLFTLFEKLLFVSLVFDI